MIRLLQQLGHEWIAAIALLAQALILFFHAVD
jgi:hypothetical protein